MSLWYIGNTSVRSAFRLRDGLVALSTSNLQGNIRGREGDRAFRNLLGQHGIVTLGEDDSYSVGRKWRSALGKLGLLYPEITNHATIRQEDIGLADTITPNGWRLIRAETVPAMQECFLRALAAQYINDNDAEGNEILFSPLRHTLAVLFEIERQTGDASISFLEMAIIVQTTNSIDNMAQIIEGILGLRAERINAPNKRQYDSSKYTEAAVTYGLVAGTFRDYADANIRYLKATGLVQNRGRGIALVPEKRLFSELLAQDTLAPETELDRFTMLCKGATLPTDNQAVALEVLHDLINQLHEMEIPFELGDRPVGTPADIAIIRHEIEEIIARENEEIYARAQAEQWEEISIYMELILSGRYRQRVDEDIEIIIPQAEAPAYLEWVLWRAFLAIDSLTNRPYEARRFRIDQDFLPVGTAPGNGPDLIMEFNDFVIVIEVTLTDNSRQEAAEGEPVRRHVADISSHYARLNGKPVLGLFVAKNIDSNTAETFRIGVWYSRDDTRMRLQIIPITLAQFCSFFRALFSADRASPDLVVQLMNECDQYRANCEAPLWKERIAQTVESQIAALVQ